MKGCATFRNYQLKAKYLVDFFIYACKRSKSSTSIITIRFPIVCKILVDRSIVVSISGVASGM